MTVEFQRDLISQLLTNKEFKTFIPDVSPDIFDLAEHKFISSALREYYKKYKVLPTLTNLLQFISNESNDTADLTDIQPEIEGLYHNKVADFQLIKDTVIMRVKEKKLKDLLKTNLTQPITDSRISTMLHDLNRIDKLGSSIQERPTPLRVTHDQLLPDRFKQQVHPTFLQGLNNLTTKGGFAPPELITFLAAPKSFKTGTLLNFALGYVKDGLKVFYADFENGADNIMMRFHQCMVGATYDEMIDGIYDDILQQQMSKLTRVGGEFIIQSYNANIHTLDDVEADILALKEQGVDIQLVCYDYLDLAKCADPTIKEDTHKVQHIYHHAISLNKKYNMFAITPSQVNRSAVNKENIDMTDFARDFGKAMNVHAAFAIMRTDEESDKGIARIGVVVQRMGNRPSKNKHNQIHVRIDENTMQVNEIIDPDELNPSLSDIEGKLQTFKH